MLEFVTDQEELRPLIEDRIGFKVDEMAKLFGFRNSDGMCIAGLSDYNGYDADIVICTVGNRAPLMLTWNHLIEYAFRVCNCERITSKVSGDNKRVAKMNRLGGMHYEGTMRKGNPETGEDVHVYSILKEETKWASQ